MLSVRCTIFCTVVSSIKQVGSFFSVAITTPFLAFTPRDVLPDATALSAYSIWTSFPDGEKVVSEKEYADSAIWRPRGGFLRRSRGV